MTVAQSAASAANPTAASRPASYTPLAVLQQAADARREAVDGAVSNALSSDSLKPDESVKAMARSQVQALIDRVNILKKLYAGNPREMAQALAQVFKELKAALKAYQQATGDELGMAGDLATGGMAQAQASQAAAPPTAAPQATAPEDTSAPAQYDATQSQTAATTDGAPPGPAAPTESSDAAETPGSTDAPSAAPAAAAPTSAGALSYAAVNQGVREAVGRDEQSFISDVRGLAQALSDILASARIQAKGAKPDKVTTKAFEDADKQYASLEHALDDADRDLHNAVPTLGLHLSVAA